MIYCYRLMTWRSKFNKDIKYLSNQVLHAIYVTFDLKDLLLNIFNF